MLLYYTPSHSKEFNPFVLKRTFYGSYDDTVCLDWTSDSRLNYFTHSVSLSCNFTNILLFRVLVAGSKDMSTRVHATERFKNLICYVLGGHNEAIVGCFFEKNSLNVILFINKLYFSDLNQTNFDFSCTLLVVMVV